MSLGVFICLFVWIRRVRSFSLDVRFRWSQCRYVRITVVPGLILIVWLVFSFSHLEIGAEEFYCFFQTVSNNIHSRNSCSRKMNIQLFFVPTVLKTDTIHYPHIQQGCYYWTFDPLLLSKVAPEPRHTSRSECARLCFIATGYSVATTARWAVRGLHVEGQIWGMETMLCHDVTYFVSFNATFQAPNRMLLLL